MGNILSCFPVGDEGWMSLTAETFAPRRDRDQPSLRQLVGSPETCPGVHAINHVHMHSDCHYSMSSLRCCCQVSSEPLQSSDPAQDLPDTLDFEDTPAGAGHVWDFLLCRSHTDLPSGAFEYQASQYVPDDDLEDDAATWSDDYAWDDADAYAEFQEIFAVHRSALYGHLLQHRLACSAHQVFRGEASTAAACGSDTEDANSDEEEFEVPEYEPEYWDTYTVCAGGPRRRVVLIRTPPGEVVPHRNAAHSAAYW